MGDSKLIKHIAGISAGLMFAVGAGAVVSSQNMVKASTVTATQVKLLEGHETVDDEGRKIMPIDSYLDKIASWNTTPNPYKLNGHNNIKFHWYKKAHVRGAWDNTDMHDSQAINGLEDGSSETGGKRPVMGEATVNGVHYYIVGDPNENEMICRGTRELEPSAYFEQPKLGYMTKSVPLYFMSVLNTKYDGTGYDGMILQKSLNKALKHTTILIPSHHNAVELFGIKYIPIIFTTTYGSTGGGLMKESDFQKYVASGEGHKFTYNGETNYQKNGRVYSKEKDVYQAAKIESRKLKSAKRRKSYEKRIINDLKHDKKMQTLYGLA